MFNNESSQRSSKRRCRRQSTVSAAPIPFAPHPVVEQQAASASQNQPQIFAGPGGFSFQSADGASQIRFHGEFDFDGRFYNDSIRR
jgi:hypothetical protein